MQRAELNLKQTLWHKNTCVWSETSGHLAVFTMKLQVIVFSIEVLLQIISIGIYLLCVYRRIELVF